MLWRPAGRCGKRPWSPSSHAAWPLVGMRRRRRRIVRRDRDSVEKPVAVIAPSHGARVEVEYPEYPGAPLFQTATIAVPAADLSQADRPGAAASAFRPPPQVSAPASTGQASPGAPSRLVEPEARNAVRRAGRGPAAGVGGIVRAAAVGEPDRSVPADAPPRRIGPPLTLTDPGRRGHAEWAPGAGTRSDRAGRGGPRRGARSRGRAPGRRSTPSRWPPAAGAMSRARRDGVPVRRAAARRGRVERRPLERSRVQRRFSITISTRRLRERPAGSSAPSGVVLGATGFDSPKPRATMRSPARLRSAAPAARTRRGARTGSG